MIPAARSAADLICPVLSAKRLPAGTPSDLITFTSDVSGRDEIYLINANGTNVRRVTDQGGMGASWLPQ